MPCRVRLVWASLSLLSCILPRLSAQDLRYLRHQSWSTEEGLPQNSVHAIQQSADGFLWIATEAGLARFDGYSFKRFDHSNEPAFRSDDICCLANAPDGSLRIGTSDGLVLLQHGRFIRAKADEPFPAQNDQPLHGPAGSIWSSTNTAVTFTSGTNSLTWHAGSDLPGSRIESLFVDRHGIAWVGTNDGLVILHPGTKAATSIDALRGNAVLQTYEDHEGNYWIGTETSGLHILRPVAFRTEPSLADKALTTVIQATDGATWIGTRNDGLRRIVNSTTTQPAKLESLTSSVILSLAPGLDGSVWAGTPDGLNHVSQDGTVKKITSAEGLPDDYIQALLTAPDGSLWIGTRHGLVHLHDAVMDVLTAANGLGGDLVGTLMLTRQNELWIGTSGGLSHRSTEGKIKNFTSRDGLPQGIVTALAEDSAGRLWIATSAGALASLTQGVIHTVTTQSLDAPIHAIVPDQHGYLWLRTEHGIQRVLAADLAACAQGQTCPAQTNTYGLADGLPSEEMIAAGSPAMTMMANGELWSATRRGAAITDPATLQTSLIPPPVVIERLLVDEAPITLDGSSIEIPPGHVRYTLEFAALTFTTPSKVRYRYRLEGLDKGWTDAANKRSATYTNLPGKDYTFRVQAMNSDGLWSPTGAVLTFRVVRPFYKRWWFFTLLAALAVLAAIALYRRRLQRLQSRFDAVLQERSRIAREVHDTLAQDFVGVSIQLDIVTHLLTSNKTAAALEQVRQTRTLVTEGLAAARQSIWKLRANLAQDSLPTRLAEIVKRYTSDQLPIRLKIGGAFRDLDDSTENEILRIAQEALSNVQRHADASEASVDLRYESDMLVLTIQDNGTGFDPTRAARLEGHYGISGMKERTTLLGGSLELASTPGTGTTILLTIPMTA
ncbi:sensor histidine kinase [Granulicella tundricola]|uniref:Histidine kinase n=1 Tax=Granulicella tundricola (strain ATCC BAA-1859 / DSM 23138 / MP5ACTX9) TaxID=1198114 RepID=E8WYP1_GRATM|nr:sensor histidine kinase [Granulicella tundricola]ADW67639.1 histidine kinase [Granulicella tundricola MP5ACTX9]